MRLTMLPISRTSSKGGKLDIASELSKQSTVFAIFVLMCLVPLGSYYFLHRWSLPHPHACMLNTWFLPLDEVSPMHHSMMASMTCLDVKLQLLLGPCRNLAMRYTRLERSMIAEMKEVTKLKQEVAELTRIKDSLALSTSALRTALRSFGRPLPAGLVEGDHSPPKERQAGSTPPKGRDPGTGQCGHHTRTECRAAGIRVCPSSSLSSGLQH